MKKKKAILQEPEFSMDHYKSISLLAYPNSPISHGIVILTPDHRKTHKNTPNKYIFTNNLHNIYLLLDHIRNPSSQISSS